VASFTMKHALLCSSTIQGGGKRRGAGMGAGYIPSSASASVLSVASGAASLEAA
jgi:hypothetical protein